MEASRACLFREQEIQRGWRRGKDVKDESGKVGKSQVAKVSCVTRRASWRTWKQPKCPSTDEWMKMWHIYTMEYYSAIKRNEIELFVVRWMDLEYFMQSEVSQKVKNKCHMLTHIYGI